MMVVGRKKSHEYIYYCYPVRQGNGSIYTCIYKIAKQNKHTICHARQVIYRGFRLRYNAVKLVKGHNRTKQRASVFSQGVINLWNNLLSLSCVESESVNSFKSVLNVAWKDHPLKFECT